MAKSLRRPPVRGTNDPDMPGYVLVPVRKPVPGFPKVNYSVPDTSYWRVDKKSNRPVAIVTVTPDGVSVAWDTCGQCSSTVRLCACGGGISCPGGVSHIFVIHGGTKPLAPQPLAVTFQPPVPPRPRRSLKRKAPEPTAKPRRSLRRLDDVPAEIAAVEAITAFRKLKRK